MNILQNLTNFSANGVRGHNGQGSHHTEWQDQPQHGGAMSERDCGLGLSRLLQNGQDVGAKHKGASSSTHPRGCPSQDT